MGGVKERQRERKRERAGEGRREGKSGREKERDHCRVRQQWGSRSTGFARAGRLKEREKWEGMEREEGEREDGE